MSYSNVYALILAGDSGEGFWPLSRKSKSKQLLSFFSSCTLLENTLERLAGLVALENTLILTSAEQGESVRFLLPEFPKENILLEPAKRDTAAAIALGTAWVSLRNHAATLAVLPADHLINNRQAFQSTLQSAIEVARKEGAPVTLGVKPTFPCANYGYIELGAAFPLHGVADCHQIIRFREKPNEDLAEAFLRAGNYRWNTGIYVWQLPALLSAFERHAPAMAAFIERIHETREIAATGQFSALPRISFEYAVMEHASRVFALEAAFDWDDVGSWHALARHLWQQDHGNVGNCRITPFEATNNLAFSSDKKHVAFVGVSDLVLVESEDVIMVCRRDRIGKIKQLLAQVPSQFH